MGEKRPLLGTLVGSKAIAKRQTQLQNHLPVTGLAFKKKPGQAFLNCEVPTWLRSVFKVSNQTAQCIHVVGLPFFFSTKGTVHTPPKYPRGIWAQVTDGPPPSNPPPLCFLWDLGSKHLT